MDAWAIVQMLVAGTAMGSIYGLIALGFTLVWRAARLINFAHAQFLMLGAYLFGVLGLRQLGLPVWASLGVGLAGTAALGWLTGRFVFLPLSRLPDIFAVIATVGVAMVVREGVRLVWGPEVWAVPGFLEEVWRFGPLVLPAAYVYILLTTVVLLAAQGALLSWTTAGRTMRAVANDHEAAALVGINVPRSVTLTLTYGSLLAGVAGLLTAPLFYVYNTMAEMVTLKAFAATVLGGWGSVPGSLAGGIVLGLCESLFGGLVSSTYRDAVAFLLLIGFLLFRPNGLLGRQLS